VVGSPKLPSNLCLRVATVLAVGAVAIPAGAVCAQDFDREVAFLMVPTGARSVGMGRAGVALAGDLQGLKWNPAAIASVGDVFPLISSYDGPLEFRVTQFAVAVPVSGVGVIALSAEVQSFGDIPLAGPSSPEDMAGTITPNNLIASVAFGRSVLDRLSVGVSAKWIRSELAGDLEGSTFAVDAGLIWLPFRSVPLDLALGAVNIGPGLRLSDLPGSQKEPLPSRVRAGLSYDILGHLRPEGHLQLRVAFDSEHALRHMETSSQYVGAELGIREVLFVRAGWLAETLIETNSGSTFGIGVRLGGFQFDLAREIGVNQLGDETQLSLSARL
jgi:hypothetical protein